MSWFERVSRTVKDLGEDLKQNREDNKRNAEIVAEEKRQQEQMELERMRAFRKTAGSLYVELDQTSKTWRLTSNKKEIFKFEDLVSYELIQDGDTVTSGGLGIGRAVVGSMLAGPIGAVLGGLTKKKKSSNIVTNLQIRITNLAAKEPTTFISLLFKKTKSGSFLHKAAMEEAHKTLGLLDIITHGTGK